ncbi:stage VI sporulation protein D [Alteribacter aurantiacus]|uniref:stage VI sporulation protein D n=1 Tax=Alteribacter aurantiacus TaxID=254410 RepID=UPI000411CBEA|nr:stage VI sporulation protein D [Alteribacter aurantiacus]
MANEQASTLSFSIQEAVWLNRGQEIDSVLSLSLDPDITIQETEDYVTVKGNLVLTGEYSPGNEVDEDQQQRNASLSEQVSFRSIEEVRVSDEGLGTIRHPFPIDVTIPRSRIQDVDQVYVNVDSFDYDLPGNGCIELQADVSISGMRGEFASAESYVDETEEETEQEARDFHFESVRPQEQEEVQEVRGEDVAEEEKEASEPVVYLNRYAEAQEEDSYEEEAEQEQQQEDVYAYAHANDMRYTANAYQDEAVEEEQEVEKEPEEEEKTYGTREEENALYLTKVLARDDEEAFTRLRMCIVQAGESLDTISARYKIPSSQIMRQNRLNEERVEEGQILYIPNRISSPTSS